MLDLAPETEDTMRDYAAREGVSTDVFTRRLLLTYTQQTSVHLRSKVRQESQAAQDSAASGETEEEVSKGDENGVNLIKQVLIDTRAQQDAQLAAVFAYIHAPKEEVIRLHGPDIARFDAELAAAANATPEEIAQADAEWEEFKRRMNAHRAVTGERPLFADDTSAVNP